MKLSPNCDMCEIILEEKHGPIYPWSLWFCVEENKLYVDNKRSNNTISVFELH